MQLYIDDVLKDDSLDADTLDRALMLFRPLRHKRLTLRREPARQLTLSRWDDEVFIEVQTPSRVEGVMAAGWDEAAVAARDYLAGRAPKARPLVSLPDLGGLIDVVIGAPDDDCPLCRALREKRA